MNQSNLTKASYCNYNENEPYDDKERGLRMATLSIVGGFGVLNNAFVIVLTAKYTMIINMLAISDGAAILMTILLAALNHFQYTLWRSQYNHFGNTIACKVIAGALCDALPNSSLVTLVIISIERFKITRRRAVQISRPYSVKTHVYLFAFCWCFPLWKTFTWEFLSSQLKRYSAQ